MSLVRSRALWVIAQIVRAGGDRRAGVKTIGAIDPLVRGSVTSRVNDAVARAMRETSSPDDDAHVHRLAFLAVSGAPAESPDDLSEVRDAFEARAKKLRAPSRYGASIAIGIAALGAALATFGGVWLATRPPAPLREELPASASAWRTGGRPDPGSQEVRFVFERKLPAYVLALEQYARMRGFPAEQPAREAVREAREDLIAASRAALGADTTSFLVAVLDQAEEIVGDPNFDTASDSHLRTVDALIAAIAERGLGYYVDAEIVTELDDGRHHVYFSTFTVERVTRYESGGERLRALRLHRLDDLNFSRNLLGFTRENISDALVLLERIEDFLIEAVLPSLALDARMPLVDDATRRAGETWVDELERAAADKTRAELATIAGDGVSTLGTLFARRQALFRTWRDRLDDTGWSVRTPRTYDIDLEDYARLEERVPSDEWRELRGVARDLEDDEPRDAYRAIEEALAGSIERHEVQHRLDYGAERLTRAPAVLESLTGPLEIDGRRNRRTRRALAELSAYLSEIAREPSIAHTNLALFSRFVFDRSQWGTNECAAMIVVFEGLARRFGMEVTLVADRSIDRATLARVMSTLRERSGHELAREASELWEELFGAPLPELER